MILTIIAGAMPNFMKIAPVIHGIPRITLRDDTKSPEACTIGANELIGTIPTAIKPTLEKLFAGKWKKRGIPVLWDGETAKRNINETFKIKK